MAERIYDTRIIKDKIAEQLKREFPNLVFTISRDSNTIRITWRKGNIMPFTDSSTQYLGSINEYYIDNDERLTQEAKNVLKRVKQISDQYNWNNSDPMTDYFDVNFYLTLVIGSYDKPYQYVPSKSTSARGYTPSSSGRTTNFPKGDVLKECAGWEITKKEISGGRIVYNARKGKDTPPNKSDWNAIKGEIYVETGFKWGRFGAFEKWGEMSTNDENLIFDRLCTVLSKYYQPSGATTPSVPEPQPMPEPTTPEPATPEPFVINESYKSLPANPKLEYCKINWAEGFADYTDTFPRDFQSFTALTKYIADNIGEIPDKGYDKHGVEWKWTFENQEHTDRWDVSVGEANPLKYPNLYASEQMQSLCYYAWVIDGADDTETAGQDEFYATKVGKDGFELTNEQFNEMLNGFLTYYPNDPARFAYNTTKERLERFKQSYPKLYNLFQQAEPKGVITEKQKEDARVLIKTLELLGDNEKAKILIKTLKLILI